MSLPSFILFCQYFVDIPSFNSGSPLCKLGHLGQKKLDIFGTPLNGINYEKLFFKLRRTTRIDPNYDRNKSSKNPILTVVGIFYKPDYRYEKLTLTKINRRSV